MTSAFVTERNPNGGQELLLIPPSNLSLRSADALGCYLPKTSSLGVWGAKETIRAPSEGGLLILPALLPCMPPLLSDTPMFHSPDPLPACGQVHIYTNSTYSFCKGSHMGSSWDSQVPFYRI